VARKPRNFYAGGLYHIICRGNNASYIFQKDEDKSKFLELVQRYKKRYGFILYAFVIMDNHVHMLVKQQEVLLSKIMQGILQVYTQYFNKKYKRSGHVFEQRFKAIHCDEDIYLLSLIRYIHQNPIRANIRSGFDYRWSSHRIYIRGEQNSFVDINFPLGIFDANKKKAIKQYLSFVYDMDMRKSIESGAMEVAVADDLPPSLEDSMESSEVQIHTALDEIAKNVCQELQVEVEELKSKTKRNKISFARKVFVWLVHEYTCISQKEIATFLDRSEPAISKIVVEAYEKQPKDLIDTVDKIIANFEIKKVKK